MRVLIVLSNPYVFIYTIEKTQYRQRNIDSHIPNAIIPFDPMFKAYPHNSDIKMDKNVIWRENDLSVNALLIKIVFSIENTFL